MPATVVVGTQWGDEGKGKLIDILAEQADMVVRYQGGHNAGHTIVVGEQSFAVRLIPSGILHPAVVNVIGNGVVVDPRILLGELDALAKEKNAVLAKVYNRLGPSPDEMADFYLGEVAPRLAPRIVDSVDLV